MADGDSAGQAIQAQAGHAGIRGIGHEDRVVVVLGAGASISEMKAHYAAQGLSDVPIPPADANFLGVAEQVCPKLHAELCALFKEVWGDVAPYPLAHQRMEQLFTTAFMKVARTKGTTKAGRSARALLDATVILLANTLVRTTELAVPLQHRRLLQELKAADPAELTVIDFNYDVLADRALYHGKKGELWRWDYRDGYGFKPKGASSPRDASDLLALKMHGSMNWYIPVPGKKRKAAFNVRALVYVPNPNSTKGGLVWRRVQQVEGHKTSRRIFPLIVPPVFEKSTQISGTIAGMWDLAEERLSRATLVLVWGYSLPATDYHAEIMFAQAARRATFNLIVVNPDRAALARVTDVCGHAWTRWFFDIEDFFRFVDRGWVGERHLNPPRD